MEKEVEKENNKNKEKGETFYEAVPVTVAMPKALHLPKVKASTIDFLESVVIFFAGTAGVLLLVRTIMMALGVNGGNLLSYLLYATSYPFVLAMNSSQQQIPSLTSNLIAENVAIMIMYFVVSYICILALKGLREEEGK